MSNLDDAAFARGIDRIGALRVHFTVSITHPWTYFAEETQSWWLVTEKAVIDAGNMEPFDMDTWASTDSTGKEHGYRRPRMSA